MRKVIDLGYSVSLDCTVEFCMVAHGKSMISFKRFVDLALSGSEN